MGSKYGQIILEAAFKSDKARKDMSDFLKASIDSGKILTSESSKRLQLSIAAQSSYVAGYKRSLSEMVRAETSSQKTIRDIVSKGLRSQEADLKESVSRRTSIMKSAASQAPTPTGGGGMFAGGAASLAGLVPQAAAALAAAEVTKKSVEYLTDAADLAGDALETLNKVDVIFGSKASGVKKWSEDAVNSLGLTKKEAQDAASTYGALLSAAGVAQDKIAGMSEQLVSRATDISSLMNSKLPDTLAAIQSGLQGEAEPLRRFGILLSEATVKQEALTLGLGKVPPNAQKASQAQTAVAVAMDRLNQAIEKHGRESSQAQSASARLSRAQELLAKSQGNTNRELSEGEKVAARYSLILKQSSNAAGDWIKTQDSAANSERRLTAQTKQLQTEIGQKLLPLKAQFLSFFSEGMDVAKDLTDVIGELGNTIADWDKKNFGVGEGMERAKGSFKALVDMIHLWKTERDKANTELGKASQTSDDVLMFQQAKTNLKEVNRLAGLYGPGDSRVVDLNQRTMTPELLRRAEALGVNTSYRLRTPDGNVAVVDNALATAQSKQRDQYAAASASVKKEKHDQEAADRADAEKRKQTALAEANRIKAEHDAQVKQQQASDAAAKAEADRMEASRKAEEAKTAAQRKAEKAKKDREAAEDERYELGIKKRNDFFDATMEGLKTAKDGTGEHIRNLANQQSKSIFDASNDNAVRLFERDKVEKPLEAGARLTAELYQNNQELIKRRLAIIAGTNEYEARIQASAKKEADKRDEANDKTLTAYGSFLSDVDAPQLQQQLEKAMRAGDNAAIKNAINAIYDNATRQAGAQYVRDLGTATNPMEVKLAEGKGVLAIDAATKARDEASARNNVLQYLSQTGIGMPSATTTPEAERRWQQHIDRVNDRKEGETGFAQTALYGARDTATSLLKGAIGGGDNGKTLESAFMNLGQIAGESIADYAAKRFIDGPMDRFFDMIAQKIEAGGVAAGNGILAGASALSAVASIFANQDKKKRGGGLFGAILGGVGGFLLGGVPGALTGLSVGANLGQGNILGAALAYGTSTLGGGLFGKAGAGIKNVSVPSTVPTFADGGTTRAGRLIRAGEVGDELAFSMGRVGILGDGLYRPSKDTTILPTDVSRRLIATAAQMAGGDGAAPVGTRNQTINYFGDVFDRQDVETNDRHALMMQRARG